MAKVKDPRNDPPRAAKVTLRVASGGGKRYEENEVFNVIFDDLQGLLPDDPNNLSLEITLDNDETVTFLVLNANNRSQRPYKPGLALLDRRIFLSPATAKFDPPVGVKGKVVINYDGNEITDVDFLVDHLEVFTADKVEVYNNAPNSANYGFKACIPLLDNCTIDIRPDSSGNVPLDHFGDGAMLFLMAFRGDNSNPDPDSIRIATIPFIKDSNASNTVRYTFREEEMFDPPIEIS